MTLHSICSDAEHKGNVTREEKDMILSSLYAEFAKVESYLNGLN